MKSITQPLAALGAALLIGTLVACSAPKLDAPEPEQQTTQTPADSAPEAEPTEEPIVDDAGTLGNPFPAGTPLVMTDAGDNDLYTITATLTNGDATAALIEVNQFNDLPAAGFKYVVVNVTYTGINATKPVNPGVESYSLRLADAAGTVYQQATVVGGGTAMYEGADLYEGQTFTGEIIFSVPVDVGALYLTALGVYVVV